MHSDTYGLRWMPVLSNHLSRLENCTPIVCGEKKGQGFVESHGRSVKNLHLTFLDSRDRQNWLQSEGHTFNLHGAQALYKDAASTM